MKKSDYATAEDLVTRHYRRVLDEMTEEILTAGEPNADVFRSAVYDSGGNIDGIVQSYAQRLWSITACREYLRHAAESRPQPPQVATIKCPSTDVAKVLSEWFVQHSGVSVIHISFHGKAERRLCVIVYQDRC